MSDSRSFQRVRGMHYAVLVLFFLILFYSFLHKYLHSNFEQLVRTITGVLSVQRLGIIII